MVSAFVAQGGSLVSPGEHVGTFELLGTVFYGDTMLTSTIAAVIVVGLGFVVRARVTSEVPGTVQLAYEALTTYLSEQVFGRMGRRPAEFLLPLAITLFALILVINWIGLIPSGHSELLRPATSDVNFTYALALFVFVTAWVWGFREQGARTLRRFVQPYSVMLPLNIIEEIAKPLSLSLRLFGNILSGFIMIAVISGIPWWGLWQRGSARSDIGRLMRGSPPQVRRRPRTPSSDDVLGTRIVPRREGTPSAPRREPGLRSSARCTERRSAEIDSRQDAGLDEGEVATVG